MQKKKPRNPWFNSDKELNSTLLLLADSFRCAEQKQKSEGILGAFAFCFNFFVIPLYRADGCSGTVSLIAVVIHAWHQEKAT